MRPRLLLAALASACGVAVLSVATAAPAPAQVDPVDQANQAVDQANQAVDQANQAVAEAQAEVDQVAGAYFAALERTRQLDARIAGLQQKIDDLGQQVALLQQITSDRAVTAYKHSGSSLESIVLDTSGPEEAARRTKLLNVLNSNDEAAARALRKTQDDLSHEQRTLRTAREDQASAVARLKDQEDQVNAKLLAAQTQRQSAIDQQLQAQQQAAEEAAAAQAAAAQEAAAAAATPPPPSTDAPPPSSPPQSSSTATPSPVPASYSPTGGVNPHHDDPYLTCVRHYESSGNYQAYNPGGPAYGAYQFLQPTWDLVANHTGRGDLVGLDPRRASAYDQDEMAWDLYQWQGKRPWTADPC